VQLPPELMTPEQREEHAAWLEYDIARRWVRFAILEAALIWAPFGVVAVGYVFEAASFTVLVVAGVVALTLSMGLTTYWVVKRTGPLQRELAALRGGDSRWPATRSET
jgi:hypothetical protein